MFGPGDYELNINGYETSFYIPEPEDDLLISGNHKEGSKCEKLILTSNIYHTTSIHTPGTNPGYFPSLKAG